MDRILIRIIIYYAVNELLCFCHKSYFESFDIVLVDLLDCLCMFTDYNEESYQSSQRCSK